MNWRKLVQILQRVGTLSSEQSGAVRHFSANDFKPKTISVQNKCLVFHYTSTPIWMIMLGSVSSSIESGELSSQQSKVVRQAFAPPPGGQNSFKPKQCSVRPKPLGFRYISSPLLDDVGSCIQFNVWWSDDLTGPHRCRLYSTTNLLSTVPDQYGECGLHCSV